MASAVVKLRTMKVEAVDQMRIKQAWEMKEMQSSICWEMKLCAYQFLALFRLIPYKRFLKLPFRCAQQLDIVM